MLVSKPQFDTKELKAGDGIQVSMPKIRNYGPIKAGVPAVVTSVAPLKIEVFYFDTNEMTGRYVGIEVDQVVSGEYKLVRLLPELEETVRLPLDS